MDFANQIILVSAGLITFSIFAGVLSSRIGAPLLLVFLAFGMLAGEDGPGGIVFNDYGVAYFVGSFALALILFDGGLRTSRETINRAFGPSIILATIGVVLTAALVGLAAKFLFGFGWAEAFLLGAMGIPVVKHGNYGVSSSCGSSNVLEAITNGTRDGLVLAANVGVMLLVFTALVYMSNDILGWVGGWTGLNDAIAAAGIKPVRLIGRGRPVEGTSVFLAELVGFAGPDDGRIARLTDPDNGIAESAVFLGVYATPFDSDEIADRGEV